MVCYKYIEKFSPNPGICLTTSLSHTKTWSLGQKSLMILMCWIGSKNNKWNSPCWTASRTLFIPSSLCKLKTKEIFHLQAYRLHHYVLISLLKWSLIWFSSTETAPSWAVIPLLHRKKYLCMPVHNFGIWVTDEQLFFSQTENNKIIRYAINNRGNFCRAARQLQSNGVKCTC